MGYQEVVVKLKPFQSEKKILNIIYNEFMEAFIDLLGYYTKNKKKKYLVFGTDRHPGADFLVKKFKAIPMEEVYEYFEEKFVYKAVETEDE